MAEGEGNGPGGEGEAQVPGEEYLSWGRGRGKGGAGVQRQAVPEAASEESQGRLCLRQPNNKLFGLAMLSRLSRALPFLCKWFNSPSLNELKIVANNRPSCIPNPFTVPELASIIKVISHRFYFSIHINNDIVYDSFYAFLHPISLALVSNIFSRG